MKMPTPLLAALASLATAAAAPAYTFTITSLSFSGVPHSVVAHYSLNVTSNQGAPVSCSTTTNTSPDLAFFDERPCADSAWTWSWYDNGVGTSALLLRHAGAGADGLDVVGRRKFEAGSVKRREGMGPNGSVQYLETGDGGDFVVEAGEVREPA